jgi:hypothetical protein
MYENIAVTVISYYNTGGAEMKGKRTTTSLAHKYLHWLLDSKEN